MTSRALFSSAWPHWTTPPSVVDRARRVLGTIGLDPCSNPSSIVGALVEFELGSADKARDVDGLKPCWCAYDSAFINPPYGNAVATWAAKTAEEARHGLEAILLVPSRTDARWFHRSLWESATAIAFFRGRLRHGNPPPPTPRPSCARCGDAPCERHADVDGGSTFPSCAAYYGPRAGAFVEAFSDIARVVHIAPPREPSRPRIVIRGGQLELWPEGLE